MPFRVVLLLTIFTWAYPCTNACAQTEQESYLLYAKDLGKTYQEDTKQIQVDTIFILHDVIWKQKTKWYSADLVGSYWNPLQIEWKREGSSVRIQSYEKMDAIILTELLLNTSKSVNFVLIPLGQGVKVPPLKDQLIERNKNWGRKILLDQQQIRREGKNYYQNGCAIRYNNLTGSHMQSSRVVYLGDHQNNLINMIQIDGAVVQVVSISDSIVKTKGYSWMPRSGDSVAYTSRFKRVPYPDNSWLTKVSGQLDGRWVSTKVSQLSRGGPEPLSCSYNFQFHKNEMIVTKDLQNVTTTASCDSMGHVVNKRLRFKSATDTLNYQLNLSADFFVLDRKKHYGSISQMVMEKIDDATLVLVVDDLWRTADDATNYPHKLKIELKRE